MKASLFALGAALALAVSALAARPAPQVQAQPAAASPVAAHVDELAGLLAEARAAAHVDALAAHPWRATGDATHLGAEGVFTLELHPSGAFRFAVAGDLPMTQASDGTTVWEADWTGLAGALELGAREDATMFEAVLTGRWLDPAEFTVARPAPPADEAPEAGGAAPAEIALELRQRGGLEHAVLALDPATHLVQSVAFPDRTWRLSEQRAPAGFPFPHLLRATERSGEESVFRIATLERADDLAPAAFALPTKPPADFRFDAARPAGIESRHAKTGHLLVHPRVAGRDVGWFILDTGAGALCLTPETADALELATLGTVTASGIGGAIPAKVRRGGELQAGQLVMTVPTWVELDLAFLEPFFGVPVAGILGYDVFARAVVSIDRATPRIEIHAPGASSDLQDGGGWGRLLLDRRLPCVEASLEGDHTGVFQIDTGAMGNVVLHHAAVERWGLLDGRKTKTAQSGGVGGFRSIAVGDLAWFDLAGRRFGPLEASFEPKPSDLWTSESVVGTIGGGLLEPFTLVLDYGRRRIAFVPR